MKLTFYYLLFIIYFYLQIGMTLMSVQGSPLRIFNSTTGGGLRVGNSIVTSVDNIASNGVVHIINNVLTPSNWH